MKPICPSSRFVPLGPNMVELIKLGESNSLLRKMCSSIDVDRVLDLEGQTSSLTI